MAIEGEGDCVSMAIGGKGDCVATSDTSHMSIASHCPAFTIALLATRHTPYFTSGSVSACLSSPACKFQEGDVV